MEPRKIQKLERDMLRRVSQLLYEVRDPIVRDGLVSVSKTAISKDLRVLKVYVTVNKDEAGQQAVMQALKKATRFIRGRLGENLDIRFTPEVHFHLDDSPERAARIANILSGLSPGQDDGAVGGGGSSLAGDVDDVRDGTALDAADAHLEDEDDDGHEHHE